MHAGANALIGAAAADIGHRLIDVLFGRLGVLLEQSRGRHDLSGLAIAALRHVEPGPGLLDGMRGVGRKALVGDDLVAGFEAAERDRAGALHLAVDVHRAGAALRNAAAVFGAVETAMLPANPSQR